MARRRTKTTEGYVYIITNPAWPDVVKIGLTTRSAVAERVRQLNTADPLRSFRVWYFAKFNDAPAVERAMHRRFIRSWVNGEWFRVNPATVERVLARLAIQESRGRA